MNQTKITFTKSIGFKQELNRRVDEYFKNNQLSPKGNWEMYLKSVFFMGAAIITWLTLILAPLPSFIVVLGCILLGFLLGGIAFNVAHDANHGSYSNYKWLNYLLGHTLDLVGASSHLWRYRHNYLHHNFTNVANYDIDIQTDKLIRMCPVQEHHWYQRYQHIYVWFLYLFTALFWYFDDNRVLLTRKYGDNQIPAPKLLDYIIFFSLKLIVMGLAIVIPVMAGHNILPVVGCAILTYMTLGFIISVVFINAHVVETAEFYEKAPHITTIDEDWGVWQLKTTVDFAPNNAFVNWYVGGLNYQAIHHVLPKVCHIHYPKLALIVKELCSEYGIEYKVYPTLSSVIGANYRWLKLMGQG